MDQLQTYFRQHGAVNCVRMRRHLKNKAFKGSVFVEFADEETANKVCWGDQKSGIEGSGEELAAVNAYANRVRQIQTGGLLHSVLGCVARVGWQGAGDML